MFDSLFIANVLLPVNPLLVNMIRLDGFSLAPPPWFPRSQDFPEELNQYQIQTAALYICLVHCMELTRAFMDVPRASLKRQETQQM